MYKPLAQIGGKRENAGPKCVMLEGPASNNGESQQSLSRGRLLIVSWSLVVSTRRLHLGSANAHSPSTQDEESRLMNWPSYYALEDRCSRQARLPGYSRRAYSFMRRMRGSSMRPVARNLFVCKKLAQHTYRPGTLQACK